MDNKVTLDTKPLESFFKTIGKTQVLRTIAASGYDTVARGYLQKFLGNQQNTFKKLNIKYKNAKIRQGYSEEIWKRTGKTFSALSDGPFEGTRNKEKRGGLMFIFKNKESYLELTTLGKGSARNKKDAFWATNQRRKLFLWNSEGRRDAMDSISKKINLLYEEYARKQR
jgi:hypothetical protein